MRKEAVESILLKDGWHDIIATTFGIETFWAAEDGPCVYLDQPCFLVEIADDTVICGPMTSLLAVADSPMESKRLLSVVVHPE